MCGGGGWLIVCLYCNSISTMSHKLHGHTSLPWLCCDLEMLRLHNLHTCLVKSLCVRYPLPVLFQPGPLLLWWARFTSGTGPPPRIIPPLHTHTQRHTCIHTLTHKRHPLETVKGHSPVWTVKTRGPLTVVKLQSSFFLRGLWLAEVFFNLRKVSALFNLEFVCL